MTGEGVDTRKGPTKYDKLLKGCTLRPPPHPTTPVAEFFCRLADNSVADLGSGAFLTPGIRDGSGSYFLELRNHFLG